MGTRRLLGRIGKVLVWCIAFVCLFSVGLRFYSALQIPKAKRLLRELSTLRAAEPIEGRVWEVIRRYNFEPKARLFCETKQCYELWIENGWKLEYPRKKTWSTWFADHGGRALGYRPWLIRTLFEIKNGKVVRLLYAVSLYDGANEGISVTVNADSTMGHPEEATSEYELINPSRYELRDRILVARVGTLASSSLISATDIDFACVWRLRPCSTAWQLAPQLKPQKAWLEAQRAQFEATGEDCPLRNLYSRTRDSLDVALAEITGIGGDRNHPVGRLQIAEFIKQTSKENNVERLRLGIDEFDLSQLNQRTFPSGPKKGTKVIVFSSSPCVVPATAENVAAAKRAAADFAFLTK